MPARVSITVTKGQLATGGTSSDGLFFLHEIPGDQGMSCM